MGAFGCELLITSSWIFSYWNYCNDSFIFSVLGSHAHLWHILLVRNSFMYFTSNKFSYFIWVKREVSKRLGWELIDLFECEINEIILWLLHLYAQVSYIILALFLRLAWVVKMMQNIRAASLTYLFDLFFPW